MISVPESESVFIDYFKDLLNIVSYLLVDDRSVFVKRRSKRFYAVTITAATLAVAGIATLIFCFAVGSPVKTITASGKSVYSSDEIVSACGIVPGENIFTVSEKKVNAILTSALPYIGSVKVKRDFPDKLSLTVTATSEKYADNGIECYKTYVSRSTEVAGISQTLYYASSDILISGWAMKHVLVKIEEPFKKDNVTNLMTYELKTATLA